MYEYVPHEISTHGTGIDTEEQAFSKGTGFFSNGTSTFFLEIRDF